MAILLQTPGKLQGAMSPRKERILAQSARKKENIDVSIIPINSLFLKKQLDSISSNLN